MFMKKLGAVLGLSLAAGSAFAQTAAPDVSAATDGLTAVATAVGDIGPLMITAVAAGIVFKWVTAFLI